jgi:hypothetical protein
MRNSEVEFISRKGFPHLLQVVAADREPPYLGDLIQHDSIHFIFAGVTLKT